VVAMTISGLGFTGQILYIFPAFFENKPIDHLIGEDTQTKHVNHKVLSRALDNLYETWFTSCT